jgi:hypothetical protein
MISNMLAVLAVAAWHNSTGLAREGLLKLAECQFGAKHVVEGTTTAC